MVRFRVSVRLRVILNCELTFICVQCYDEKINEDASYGQFGLGPPRVLFCAKYKMRTSDRR